MGLRPESERSRRGRKASARTGARRSRFSLELLEDRIAPAVFNVNSTADILQPPAGTVTLRSAIQQANQTPGGNTINLTVAGTYKITHANGDFDILSGGNNLTIVNTSGGAVSVYGNHRDRVFDINPMSSTTRFTVTLQGFTVENGVASPGDGAAGSGGGIRDQGSASLTLTNMVVTNNIATADGGGVSMENTVSTPWTLTVNHSTISNNRAGDAGGGIDTDGSGTVNINQGTQITGNTSVNQGAGIWLDGIQVPNGFKGANLNVTGTLVADNKAITADNFGGGIGNAGNGTVTIQNSTIQNNFSGGVGGGFGDQNNLGTLVVKSSIIRGNVAVGDGGGLQEGGNLTMVVDSEVRDNVSGGVGGGLFANSITLNVMRSTFADNTASGGGGGIELETNGFGMATSFIVNATITGNIALNANGANGGGIDAPAGFTGAVALLNVTINADFATNGGGVFWEGTAGSSFTVQNTIIAQNFAGTGPDANNPAGTFTDRGGNLIGIAGAGGGNTGFTAGTTQSGTLANPLNPLLGPLGDNGGPAIGAPGFTMTLETEAPLLGSPAISKGILNGGPPHDERGFPAVVNGTINVGAVSQAQGLQGAPIAPAVLADTAVTAGGQAGVTATANTTTGADTATAIAAAAGSAGFTLTNTDAPSLVVTTLRDVVDSTDGLTSLREAIAYANSHPGPDTIRFDPAVFGTKPRTIRLTGGPLVLTDPTTTTILGPGARRLTVQSGGRSRVFDIQGGSAALSRLTIAGGLRNEGGPMELTRVLVRHNTARRGGGLFHTGRARHTQVNVRDHAARVGGGLVDLGAP